MREIRGIMLNAWIAFLYKKYGENTVKVALSKMSPDDRLVLDRTLLDSSWYPIEVTRSFTQLHTAVGSRAKDAEELGRFISEYTFKGVYKMFLTRDPISQVLKIKQATLYFYRNLHKLEVDITGPGVCTIRYRTTVGTPSKTTCLTRKGWWTRTLELSKATAIRVQHTRCMAAGQDCCEFLMEWVMPDA